MFCISEYPFKKSNRKQLTLRVAVRTVPYKHTVLEKKSYSLIRKGVTYPASLSNNSINCLNNS